MCRRWGVQADPLLGWGWFVCQCHRPGKERACRCVAGGENKLTGFSVVGAAAAAAIGMCKQPGRDL